MQMYDQIKELPLLIKEKIYNYLPYARYDNHCYIIMSVHLKHLNMDAGYFCCGLISRADAMGISDYSNYEVNKGGLIELHLNRYAQYETLEVEKIIYDPKEIAILVKTFGNLYYVRMNLIEHVLELVNYTDSDDENDEDD